MKIHLGLGLTLMLIFVFGCGKKPEGPAQPITLTDGASQNDLSYVVSGQGTSTNMQIQISNKSNTHWEVDIEVGTKMEPADGDIQEMVVTEEVEVEVHAEEETNVSLSAACLDISKEPPGPDNTNWTIEYSSTLAEYISGCQSKIDDYLQQNGPDSADRGTFLQFLLWKGRGATEGDFINFYQKYGDAKEKEDASEITSELYPKLEDMVSGLPDISN